MLNPFMLDPNGKWGNDAWTTTEERYAQRHGMLVKQAALLNRNQLTLRLGILLIRMGKELTGERAFQEGLKGAWFSTQAKPRPARFHHA